MEAAVKRGQPGEPLDVSGLVDFLQEGQLDKLSAADARTEPPPAKRRQPSPEQLASLLAPPEASSAPPLVGPSPSVLLMGETASAVPTREGELPYADRSMWSVLRMALGLPDGCTLAETQAATLGRGVAVWDVLANVHTRGAGKVSRQAERPNAIPSFLAAHPSISRVAFVGAKAKAAFERHHAQLAKSMDLCVLPSSSRANAQPLGVKAAAWRRALLVEA